MSPKGSPFPPALRFGPQGPGAAQGVVVLLHGLGALGQSMETFAQTLSKALPHLAVVVFDGFDRFDNDPGQRQWFSVDGVTDANRRSRIEAVLPRVQGLLEREAAAQGLAMDRMALVGFSQGAILALHLAASSTNPPATVVGLAGRVAGLFPSMAGPRPSVLLTHGVADPVISVLEMQHAALALMAAGCRVQTYGLPGHGHGVHPDQVRRVTVHLNETLGPAARLNQDAAG
jgi:phospholipase/carboxylesterase